MRRFICKLLVAAVVLNGFTLVALADALDNWTSGIVSTNPWGEDGQGFQLTGEAYGNGRYVAAGQYIEDDFGVVETSGDGTNWGVSTSYGAVLDLYDVTFANGTFVASGWDYYSGGNLWTSYDGTNWTSHTTQIANVYRVTYGNGLFVAVGDGLSLITGTQTNKNIYTSPDGTNWTVRASGAPASGGDSLSDVAYGAGTFVAVSSAGIFHKSLFGTTWTATTSTYPLSGNISFCNGLFFAPSGRGTNLVSANGTTWSALTNNTAATFGRIIYTNGLYIALSSSRGLLTSTNIFTSTNGTNWVQRNLPIPTNTLLADVVFGNGRVVAVGYQPTLPLWQIIHPAAFISDPLVAAGINRGYPPQVKISGVSNLLYGVQYSSSLSPPNWQTATNFIMSTSPSIWTDSTATNSQRYYRAAWLP
jgi:hypothetical protein